MLSRRSKRWADVYSKSARAFTGTNPLVSSDSSATMCRRLRGMLLCTHRSNWTRLRGSHASTVWTLWSFLGDGEAGVLRSLPRIRRLRFTQSEISDRGLQHVGALASLEALYLGASWRANDAGLVHLHNFETCVHCRFIIVRQTWGWQTSCRWLISKRST